MIITIGGTSFATVKKVSDDEMCALRRVFAGSVRCDMSDELPTIDIPAVPIVWSFSEGAPLLGKEPGGETTEEEQETEAERYHAESR